jgi:hypothetical protein
MKELEEAIKDIQFSLNELSGFERMLAETAFKAGLQTAADILYTQHLDGTALEAWRKIENKIDEV